MHRQLDTLFWIKAEQLILILLSSSPAAQINIPLATHVHRHAYARRTHAQAGRLLSTEMKNTLLISWFHCAYTELRGQLSRVHESGPAYCICAAIDCIGLTPLCLKGRGLYCTQTPSLGV